ncbi:MAG TPA: TerB family tellurite resistance protein [Williamwhitmania sp.]|nr:TerB family tellurite resistance protein [Williamwhitmania sp.]
MGYGKWISGALGWFFLGPIGGIAGFALGALLETKEGGKKIYTGQTSRDGFIVSLLVLVSAMMKADGKVLKSELDFVKDFLVRSFGVDMAQEAMILLRDMLKKEVPVKDVCFQVRNNVDYSARLQLVHFLFGIAKADGVVSPEELKLVEDIAGYLGISPSEYTSIKAMFVDNTEWAYQVLEISRSATNDEVKKAYRHMALKYHPDKVSQLGEDVQRAANEKIQKVNEAYNLIKKERGMS